MASAEPPAHVLLGNDAVDHVTAKLNALRAEIDAWEPISRSTDFTPAAH